MATIAVPLEPESRSVPIASPALLHSRPFRNSLITALALLALAVEGYHPFAEDGGLYAAGVERLLDPTLFPHWSSFVLAPMRVSIFAPVIAALVRISHLSIPAVLLLVQLGSIWTTLYAAYGIAECCWHSLRARTGAVVLLACWIGLPVAGSSLQIMDPYVTARSFSTPCILLGLLCVLRLTTEPGRKRALWLLLCAVSLTLGFAMHPLMAGYGIAATCLLACLRSKRRSIQFGGTISCCVAAICLAAVLQHEVAPEPAAYVRAALTRTYWFPQEWTWYELAGLLAPLAILAACLKQERPRSVARNDGLSHRMSCRVALAAMATVLGATAILVAALFARPDSVTHLVARLQPLRAFQTVYVVMILMLGALLAEYLLEQRVWRWVAAVLLLSSPVFLAERAAFPSSAHIQVSEAGDGNLWIQSFAWVRTHTPKDALFALDPDYIHAPGEDGHCFRAIAERSALPDFSKDGGEASVAPQLAESWQYGVGAQRNLGSAVDLRRNSAGAAALRAIGVSWVILRAKARTDLDCPYSNLAAKVCKINDAPALETETARRARLAVFMRSAQR